MDFRLFFNVIVRFKYLVAGGLVVACALAFLTVFKVTPHGLRYRQQEKWADTARVLVSTSTTSDQDPASLAQVYATLATSDQVTKAAIRRHRIPGTLQADFGYVNRTSTALPTISVTGISSTPERAATLANDAIGALRVFVQRQQDETGISVENQATLEDLNTAIPFTALVFSPRSKTPPVIVFVLVLAATIGLAFLLENLRPRERKGSVEVEPPATSIDARRARDQA
jgi:capsular polysaccharide biosynthesis protein